MKSSNRGDMLKRMEQMYAVYETELSVCTEIEELPSVPKFSKAARNSGFVAQLEELMGRIKPTSYGPIEPPLRLVGNIPPKGWVECKGTSESKARNPSYDDLVDLLIDLAMGRGNDSHMDKYLRKHLRSQTPGQSGPRGRSPQPDSNAGKGRGGQLKHMTQSPPSKGKGAPHLFYCCVTDNGG